MATSIWLNTKQRRRSHCKTFQHIRFLKFLPNETPNNLGPAIQNDKQQRTVSTFKNSMDNHLVKNLPDISVIGSNHRCPGCTNSCGQRFVGNGPNAKSYHCLLDESWQNSSQLVQPTFHQNITTFHSVMRFIK